MKNGCSEGACWVADLVCDKRHLVHCDHDVYEVYRSSIVILFVVDVLVILKQACKEGRQVRDA